MIAAAFGVIGLSFAVKTDDEPVADTAALVLAASVTPTPATPRQPVRPVVQTTPRITPTPPAAATAPATEADAPGVAYHVDAALQREIERVVGSDGSHLGIYVNHLDTGAGAAINPSQPYGTASLFKAFVMYEAFRQRDAGRIRFSQTMLVTPYYKSWELGTGLVQAGDVVTVDFALEAMMSVSDTPTAVLLQDTLGFEAINASLRDLGIVDSGLFYPGEPVATARDFGVLLEAVYHGIGVTHASRDEMLALLQSERLDHGLRAGLPDGVSIAHKTGSLPGLLHDAGIVFSEGGDYVIVVLSDGSAPHLIADVSRTVYEHFNPAPEAKASIVP